MKAKIDYTKKYNEIKKAAEDELKEALNKFPNQTYDFITDNDFEKLDENFKEIYDMVNVPTISILNGFDNRVFSIYVSSVSVKDDRLLISGFESPFGEIEVRNYHPYEVIACQIADIIDFLPEC